jgi:uncharacterized membrane protein YoaK (UPF0700 family)
MDPAEFGETLEKAAAEAAGEMVTLFSPVHPVAPSLYPALSDLRPTTDQALGTARQGIDYCQPRCSRPRYRLRTVRSSSLAFVNIDSHARSGIRQLAGGDPRHGPLPPLLLALTVVTGLVDAVSILQLGRVFVANMTGNVVFTGFAIAGAPGFSLSASLFALFGFLVGAMIGGTLIGRLGHDRALLLGVGAALELVLVVAACVIAAVGSTPFTSTVRNVIAALLAIGMGIQNAVARRLAVPDLTTTVLTMTLTGIAADIRSGTNRTVLLRRLASVAAMLGGGVLGASLVLHASAAVTLGVAAGLILIVTVGAGLATRRPGAWRKAPT